MGWQGPGPDEFTIAVNTADLDQALHVFQDDVSNRIIRTALRDVANTALEQLLAAAPHRTGRLASALSVRASHSGPNVRYSIVVNTRGKAGDPNNAFYWRFLEFGHLTRPNAQKVSRGYVRGLYFIRNVWLRLEATIARQFFVALDRGTNKTYTKAQP